MIFSAIASLVAAPVAATTTGWVHGYFRKDGTYIAPHYRQSPGPAHGHSSTALPRSHSSFGSSSLKRDPEERRAFVHSHPCPSTGRTSGACPGYVVDHITPLKRGGADAPSNMQWQTIDAAKTKDKWE